MLIRQLRTQHPRTVAFACLYRGWCSKGAIRKWLFEHEVRMGQFVEGRRRVPNGETYLACANVAGMCPSAACVGQLFTTSETETSVTRCFASIQNVVSRLAGLARLPMRQ
jgi:hypothetical protein